MPASEFVLHREPMLLLDRLVACTGDETICEWQVNEDDSFVEEGQGVPSYVGIEFMAQCVAVHAGVRERVEGFGPPLGFLLGTRHLRTSVSHFRVGEVYRAVCHELIRDGNGMGAYECAIMHGDVRVAEARLNVLEKERGKKLFD